MSIPVHAMLKYPHTAQSDRGELCRCWLSIRSMIVCFYVGAYGRGVVAGGVPAFGRHLGAVQPRFYSAHSKARKQKCKQWWRINAVSSHAPFNTHLLCAYMRTPAYAWEMPAPGPDRHAAALHARSARLIFRQHVNDTNTHAQRSAQQSTSGIAELRTPNSEPSELWHIDVRFMIERVPCHK